MGEDEVHLDPAAEGRAGLRGRPTKSKLASQTGVADGSGLRNVRVGHLEGHTTDILALQRLPIARADVAFVVADVGRDGGARHCLWAACRKLRTLRKPRAVGGGAASVVPARVCDSLSETR